MTQVDEYKQNRLLFMTLIGLATTEGATVEALLTTLVARLSAPPAKQRADHLAFHERRARLARKPYSAKVEVLEVLWPHRWTSVAPLARELRDAGNRRNDLAHTYEQVDFMSMIQAGAKVDDIDPGAHWMRTSRGGKKKRVNLDEIQGVYDELNELGRRLETLFFIEHQRSVPMNIAWVLANELGSVTRIDKPEQHPNFGGWIPAPQ
jgi:hypothetical protein